MTLDEALAYDADIELACEQWCSSGECRPHRRGCNCGLERARVVIATLRAVARPKATR